MIYLDNAATTFPKPESVYVAMDHMNRYAAVNAGRGSYKLAQNASRLISDTKEQLRRLLCVDSSASVIFSPSITIAMNQIIHGLKLREGAIVYMSPYEHNAVARTVHMVARRNNWKIKEIPIDESTLEIDTEKLKYEFSKEKPEAIFCTHISNVTGYVLPVAEIFKEAKKYSCITVLDSAQSLGLIEVKPLQLSADIVAFAGHKTLYGPFGIGGFVNIKNIPLDVFITGGTGSDSLDLEMPDGYEAKYEAASSNLIAIAGLNEALKILDQKMILKHEMEITNYLLGKLKSLSNLKVIAEYPSDKQVGIVSFTSSIYNSEDLGMILDEDYDIAVRTGYHCAPFIHKHLKDEKNLGTVRIGISQFTTKAEIDKLVEALSEVNC